MSPAYRSGSSRERIKPAASFPLRVSGRDHVLVSDCRRFTHLRLPILGRSRSQPSSSGPLLHVFHPNGIPDQEDLPVLPWSHILVVHMILPLAGECRKRSI